MLCKLSWTFRNKLSQKKIKNLLKIMSTYYVNLRFGVKRMFA